MNAPFPTLAPGETAPARSAQRYAGAEARN